MIDTEKAYRANLMVALHLRASQTLQQTACCSKLTATVFEHCIACSVANACLLAACIQLDTCPQEPDQR